MGRAVVDDRQRRCAITCIVRAAFDRDHRLRRCRKHRLRAESASRHCPFRAAGARRPPARVASTSPGLELRQPRLHIAAQGHDLEVGPKREQLRLPPRRGGPDHRAFRQARRSTPRRSAGPARRRAGSIAARVISRGPDRFDVLHRMDAEIDLVRPAARDRAPWSTAPCRQPRPAAGPGSCRRSSRPA